MEVTVAGQDVVVEAAADATVGDLCRAAGAALGHPADRPLATLGLRRGEVLGARAEAAGVAALAVVGGLDAGRRASLPPGPAVVGRAPGSALACLDPTVSRHHAEVLVEPDGAVAVRDLRSRNGTWLGGAAIGAAFAPLEPGTPLRLGAAEVAVVDPDPGDAPVRSPARPSPSGTVPFNRPPRPAPPRPPAPVAVPDPPSPAAPPVALGVMAVVGPIAMAAVLVVAMGNPLFALLALLSPVLAVGNHLEARRRVRTGRRGDARQRAADLARVGAALAAARDAEADRRRREAPDPAEVLRRAEQPSTRLWERRLDHPDALCLRAGTGDVPWSPPLDGDRHPRPADLDAVVAAHAVLRATAATVELGVAGIVGPRAAALAVARSLLCQAAVHHGPADLPVLVAAGAGRGPAWDWAKWLPHVDDPAAGTRRLAVGRDAADGLAAAFGGGLVVVDGDEILEGRRSAVRSLLAGGAHGIVVAAAVDRLPASCTTVVVVDAGGDVELREPALARRLVGLRAAGMAEDTAARCARALARFDDPELDVPGAGLPDEVRLAELLRLDRIDADAIARRWRRPSTTSPLGMAADGVVDIDLAADGPHALVAGTTGAGKSELLRTLVAGLAAAADPDHLTFVLIDFKGGGAFDACARLPHVVGVVTDLDDDLAARALRCLEAELRHRERVLRSGAAAPPPRLVVVVDEFATLKAEVPGFVDALVGVAQRGRSLGMHLVLATQRPSGAVSDDIRANTNLRIALRVQDAGESADVLGIADAAHLPRHRPGRACIRLGPGEVVTVQTALATAAPAARQAKVHLRPFTFGAGEPAAPPAARTATGPTDLDRLVDACAAAWAATGRPLPRRPWPDPLPEVVDRSTLPPGAAALADDPDGQRHVALGWRPADGNLALVGAGGSGTTTTLVAVACALAEAHGPDRLHLYGIDHGAGELAVLAALPHTGAVVAAAERERQVRLVRRLRAELDRRRAAPPGAAEPSIVVLVDGIAGFLAQFDAVAGLDVLDAFERVFADGPDVGIHVALTAARPGALPAALGSLVRHRWVHRLADPLDAGAAGVTGRPLASVAGRFVDVVSGLVAHTGTPRDGWAATVGACAERWRGTPVTAAPVGELPAAVARVRGAPFGERPWRLVLGVADDDLGPAALAVWDGDHVLVAGPPRSGRTTALATIAAAARDGGARVVAVAVAGRGSWLASVDGVEAATVEDVAALGGPAFVLVDDAEVVDDPAGVLDGLASGSAPGVHLVAAGRAEVLRGLYAHWTRGVRRSRTGLLLRPHLDLDGELLATPLPRRVGVPFVAGRGFLVADGAARLVQVALPG